MIGGAAVKSLDAGLDAMTERGAAIVSVTAQGATPHLHRSVLQQAGLLSPPDCPDCATESVESGTCAWHEAAFPVVESRGAIANAMPACHSSSVAKMIPRCKCRAIEPYGSRHA